LKHYPNKNYLKIVALTAATSFYAWTPAWNRFFCHQL